MTTRKNQTAFDDIARSEWQAVPERIRSRIRNVLLIIEDAPMREDLEAQGMGPDDTLLGLYKGVPLVERGEGYDDATPFPDTITLYRIPHIEIADGDLEVLRSEIRATIWHELAHHFGFDESMVEERENSGTNEYR